MLPQSGRVFCSTIVGVGSNPTGCKFFANHLPQAHPTWKGCQQKFSVKFSCFGHAITARPWRLRKKEQSHTQTTHLNIAPTCSTLHNTNAVTHSSCQHGTVCKLWSRIVSHPSFPLPPAPTLFEVPGAVVLAFTPRMCHDTSPATR